MHEELTPIKRALLELRQLRKHIEESERARNEPVAIVGAGLRLPGGVADLSSFWELLMGGKDAISEIPADRWDIASFFDSNEDKPGRMYSRHGAFVDAVDQFDPEFFGIILREAESIDPQHRLLLEVAWEALENAGIAPPSLAGTQTGVFVGLSNSDYLRKLVRDPHDIDAYSALGGAPAIAAGRISYTLGTQGVSLVIDTACSSSLVAIHAACQSLRLGESGLALAGGVNLILSPEMNISLSRAHMLAHDGRCKTFDAQADGYVRGEGCGMVVLKLLSQAVASGDRILAVIRGSAVNQDGRSAGITAPNGRTQEAVIGSALKQAGLDPLDVDYVEAHGTGTPLGDPIEVRALAAAYCKQRTPESPLRIGSVKTNIGHLESAAGIAGLIKTILAMNQGVIPPHRNLTELNPYIDWSSLPIQVVTSPTPWPAGSRRRIAGISSFGFSGTNCHILLEEPPAPVPAEANPVTGVDRPLHILCVSAKSEPALKDLVGRFEGHLGSATGSLADICFTANAGRAHHSHRLAVKAATAQQVRDQLAGWQAGDSPSGIVQGTSLEAAPPLAFLFTGQGSQYVHMARGLYDSSPVFRAALEQCDAIASRSLPQSLTSAIFSEDSPGTQLQQTAWTQPALFAVEYALAQLWRSWGIVPDIVLGHSIGEYTAACVAGVLKLEDALALVIKRGSLMQNLPQNGGMTAVFASESVVQDAISSFSGELAIAAVNGPEHVVISGEMSALQRVTEKFTTNGIATRPLHVSHAFHSPLMDPVLDALEQALSEVEFGVPQIALVSNLTGKIESRLFQTPLYWRRHARECVRFEDGIQAILDRGPHIFVEMGPQPVLSSLLLKMRPEQTALASLRRGSGDWESMLESLQVLYSRGRAVDWTAFDKPYQRRKVGLPTYPFQRKRCWFGSTPAADFAETRRLAWSALTLAASTQSKLGPLGWDIRSYSERWECLDRLTSAHIQNALVGMGAFQVPGEAFTAPVLLAHFGVPNMYLKLLARRLGKLADLGVLDRREHGFLSRTPLERVDLAPLWRETEGHLRDNPHLLAYLRNCGEKLEAVLAGRESPLSTLFPDGSFELAENLYERSSESQYSNPIVAAAVQAAAQPLSSKADVRILEIGGGTGSTTSAVLPVLPPDRSEYWFTDVSDQFLVRASEKFAGFPFLRYVRLDLDRPLEPQGIPVGKFDIVVASNVVHAMSNLGAALERIRSVLAPGGMLVLLETTLHHSWFDMTTGLIEGWQIFDDGYRHDDPLLDAPTWLEVLKQHGFERAAQFPESGSYAEATGQHIIVAQAPAVASSERPAGEQAQPSEMHAARSIGTQPDSAGVGFLAGLTAAPEVEREEMMLAYVGTVVKRVFRLGEDRELGPRERFSDLGMDSLMALELKGALVRGLGPQIRIPSTIAFDTGTAEELAKSLLRIHFDTEAPLALPSPSPGNAIEPLSAEQLNELSDQEVEMIMMERLRTN